MAKEFTKEEVILNKKDAIKTLNKMLEYFINTPSEKHLKKANLISTWIKTYSNMIAFEEEFDPNRNIAYKRGDVLFVDFGFGIGSEFGGKHYAVVLDKHNYRNASSITVVPLSSSKEGKPIYKRDLYLGNELYEKLSLKLKTHLPELRKQNMENRQILETIQKFIDFPNENFSESEITKLQNELLNRLEETGKSIASMEQVKKQIDLLKPGSIAKIEQIRTISKIRICSPTNKWHPLFGIRLTEKTMQNINAQIKELYIFDE